MSHPANPILVAVDTTDLQAATALSERLTGHVGGVKLGKEFFTAHGPQGVGRVIAGGQPLFLDLKWHDIPNTVAGAVKASLPLKPAIVNVHASGGAVMMKAAAEAAASAGADRPKVIAVTVLTSMGAEDLKGIGIDASPEEQVVRLARLAKDSGMDGVVCSAREIGPIRQAVGKDFLLVVPGIRPAWSASDDQKRIMTPREAMQAGADHLVIGRPITRADDPAAAADRVMAEINGQ